MPPTPDWADPRLHTTILDRARRLRIDQRVQVRFDPEDVVGETFRRVIAAQGGAGAYRGTTDGELFRYLHNYLEATLADLHREHRAQKRDTAREAEWAFNQALTDSLPAGIAGLADDQTSPSQAAARNEERGQLAAEIAALPYRERAAVELQQAGHTIAEIAAALGTTPGAVGGLLFRATARLRERLNPGADEGTP